MLITRLIVKKDTKDHILVLYSQQIAFTCDTTAVHKLRVSLYTL